MNGRLKAAWLAAAVVLAVGAGSAHADGARVGSEAEVISEEGANLRDAASTDGLVLELVKGGRIVFVLDESDGWFQVEFDGTKGWVHGGLIGPARARPSSRGNAVERPVEVPNVRLGSEAQIATEGGLNLRSAPGVDSSVVELVKNNRIVYVVDGPTEQSDGHWYKVEFDGTVGWLHGSFLTRATRGAAPPPPAAAAAASRAVPAAAPAAAPAPAPAPGNTGEAIAAKALQYVGHPYAWGGTSPRYGFDCSGLIQYVMGQLGIWPGRTSQDQAGAGVSVTGQELFPGDIVVFANTYGRGYTHTGIYIGGGRFVHAEDYGTGVRVSSLHGGYWGAHYAGARRVW